MLLLGAAALTGCASITTGNRQNIAIQATANEQPLAGAECVATNDKGSWAVATPGSVDVQLSFQDLSVKCESPTYEPGLTTFKSTTKAVAFGNIIFGGVIGAAIDVSSGAAFEYPSSMSVAMGKPTGATPLAKKEPAPMASLPALQRGDVLEYVVTDRYTGNKRPAKLAVDSSNDNELTFNGGSRVEQKSAQTAKTTTSSLGDMDLFEPPLGWGRRNMVLGASWRDSYTVNDGGYNADVQMSGTYVRNEAFKLGAISVDAAYVEYTGAASRSVGTMNIQHRAQFKAWVEKSTGRVLRFESDLSSSTGSQTGRNSREALELVRLLRYGNPV